MAHWGVFSMSEAVREENALMSYGFLLSKSLRRCRRFSVAFLLFACDIGFPLSVGRPEVRPTDLRMAVFTSVASHSGLDEG